MAKWGNVDYKQLQRLQKKMQKFEEVDADILMRKIVKNLAARILRSAIKLTPNVSGELSRAWNVKEVVQIGNSTYEIEIINSMAYASYVEYGHRQTPGRFVPGYWKGNEFVYVKGAKTGMVLKASWVKGRFMLTKSEQMIERKKDKIIEKMLEDELKKVFSGD